MLSWIDKHIHKLTWAYIYALMLVTLQSCSIIWFKTKINLVDHNGQEVESLLLPHVLEYEKVCNRKVSLKIYFEKMEGPVVGVCRSFIGPDSWKEIAISIDFFKQARIEQMEALVFHELGHCDLGRSHVQSYTGESYFDRPVSLMYYQVLDAWTYTVHKAEYIKELCYEPEEIPIYPLRTFMRTFKF